MESNPLECSICRELYNLQERQPMSLRCGHTVCSYCLKNIKDIPILYNRYSERFGEFSASYKCPTCRQQSKDFFVNYALRDQIDNQKSKSICKIHKKEEDLICIDCKHIICYKCEKETHKSHQIEDLEEILKNLQTKTKLYHTHAKKLDAFKKEFNEKKNEHQEMLQALIEKKLSNLESTIGKIRSKLYDQLKEEIETIKLDQFLSGEELSLENFNLSDKDLKDLKSLNPEKIIKMKEYELYEIKEIAEKEILATLEERLDEIKILWPKLDLSTDVKILNEPTYNFTEHVAEIHRAACDEFFWSEDNFDDYLEGSEVAIKASRFSFINYKQSEKIIQEENKFEDEDLFNSYTYINKYDKNQALTCIKDIKWELMPENFDNRRVVSFLGSNLKCEIFTDKFDYLKVTESDQFVSFKYESDFIQICCSSFESKVEGIKTPIQETTMNEIIEQFCLDKSSLIVVVVDDESKNDWLLFDRMLEKFIKSIREQSKTLIRLQYLKCQSRKELNKLIVEFESSQINLSRRSGKNDAGSDMTYYKDDRVDDCYTFLICPNKSEAGKHVNDFAISELQDLIYKSTPIKKIPNLHEKIHALLSENLRVYQNESEKKTIPEKLDENFGVSLPSSPKIGFTLYKQTDSILVMEVETIGQLNYDKINAQFITLQPQSTFAIKITLHKPLNRQNKQSIIQDSRSEETIEIETKPLYFKDFSKVDFKKNCKPYYESGFLIIKWGTDIRPSDDLL